MAQQQLDGKKLIAHSQRKVSATVRRRAHFHTLIPKKSVTSGSSVNAGEENHVGIYTRKNQKKRYFASITINGESVGGGIPVGLFIKQAQQKLKKWERDLNAYEKEKTSHDHQPVTAEAGLPRKNLVQRGQKLLLGWARGKGLLSEMEGTDV